MELRSPYTPRFLERLMIECETEIEYKLSGEVKGKTDRAQNVVKCLGLNDRGLEERRKRSL